MGVYSCKISLREPRTPWICKHCLTVRTDAASIRFCSYAGVVRSLCFPSLWSRLQIMQGGLLTHGEVVLACTDLEGHLVKQTVLLEVSQANFVQLILIASKT